MPADGVRPRLKAVGIRTAAVLGAALLCIVALVVVTGLLYLWQARLPGPRLSDAMPLDELPGRAWAPALAFVPLWLGAGLLLGLFCRWARLGRLTAAVVLGAAVAAAYVNTAVSIWIVRQNTTQQAIHAAAHVRAVPLAAALCAVGGAVMARSGNRRGPTATTGTIAAFVVMIGLADLILPLVHAQVGLDPVPTSMFIPPVSEALVPAVGLLLIVLGRGLARGHRDALVATVVLVTLSAELEVLTRVDQTVAPLNLFALAVLLACRHQFTGRGDPARRLRLAAWAAAALGAIVAYGTAAIWINGASADQPVTPTFVLAEVGRAMLGTNIAGSAHLAGSFGRVFPLSMTLLTATAAVLLVRAWLAPWRYRPAQADDAADTARALVAAHGADTLSPFTLRRDKSYFVGRDGAAFLAYRVVARVAVVSGDPVGLPGAEPGVFDEFVDFAHERGWRVAMLGASTRLVGHYRARGFHTLYHGDEAMIDVDSFSLEGRTIRKVRQSVHRLERTGYACEVRTAGECDGALRDEMRGVLTGYLRGGPMRGFTMELDDLFRLEGEHAVFVIGRDPSGAVAGFLHFAAVQADAVLSLSSMPRRADTPNGFNEWLIVHAIEWSREHRIAALSMNFAPFAHLLDPAARLSLLQRAERRTLVGLKGRFQLDSLYRFNDKFAPRWNPRYLVYEAAADLPRVGLATLAAESYLTPKPARS